MSSKTITIARSSLKIICLSEKQLGHPTCPFVALFNDLSPDVGCLFASAKEIPKHGSQRICAGHHGQG